MIQGRSNFVYRIVGTNKFVSLGLKEQYRTQALYVDCLLYTSSDPEVEFAFLA